MIIQIALGVLVALLSFEGIKFLIQYEDRLHARRARQRIYEMMKEFEEAQLKGVKGGKNTKITKSKRQSARVRTSKPVSSPQNRRTR